MNFIRIYLFLSIVFINLFSSTKLEKVSLQLLWKHQFEFAGFYIAKEKGYYKDYGLDVEFKEFDKNTDIAKDISNGISDFGIAYNSIIVNKSKGEDVILLNALLQSSPLILLTLQRDDLKSIKDFKGKSVVLDGDSSNEILLNKMIKTQNITFDDMLKIKNTSFKNMINKKENFGLNDLINKKIDVIMAYSTNEPYILEKKSIKYNIYNPQDYYLDSYNNFLFTSNKYLKKNKDNVINFQKASLKGWEYAFNHIDEAINLIYKKYNTQNKSKDMLLYEANKLKKLAYYKTDKIGTIKNDKLSKLISYFKSENLIKNEINLNTFVFTDNKTSKIKYNKKEIQWFKEHKNIKMCIDPNWMPFEMIKEGKHIGMSADYIKEIQKNIPNKIELIKTNTWEQTIVFLKQRKCDIVSLMTKTKQRTQYLNFTNDYLKSSLVIATKDDKHFIDDFESLKGKKIAIPKSYANFKILKQKYPYLDIVGVKNIQDGLKKVEYGIVYGYIGSLESIGYEISKNYIGEIKISGKFDDKWTLGMGVRNDDMILLSILNKSIALLDDNIKDKILNNWTKVKYDNKYDYYIIKYILLFFIIVVLIFLYRQYILKDEIKHYDELMNSIVEGLLITKNGIVLKANKSICDLLAYKDKSELIGKSSIEFIADKSKEIVIQNIKTHQLTSYDIICLTKDKKEFPVNIHIKELKNGCHLVSIIDLSLIKKQEENLIAQSRMAAMGEMIGNIAHQWRQPLSIISTNATSLLMQSDLGILEAKTLNKACNYINSNAQYLSKTIDDFRDFIKGDTIKVKFELYSNIESCLHLLEGTLKNNNIKIVFEKKDDIYIRGYDNELIQCYINIINNSKDAFIINNIEDKIIIIDITQNENSVIITIKDNAKGISENIINNIFDPYFTTKDKKQGTGLGLNMTYKLITQSMNGSIKAYNEEFSYEGNIYNGAKFEIILPKN